MIAGAIGAARGREAADAARKAFEPAGVLRVRSAPVRHREHLDLARDHVDQSEARARRGQAEIDDADAVGLRDIARLHRELFPGDGKIVDRRRQGRSEEHTSELQSLMRTSYAVFCLKKKKNKRTNTLRQRVQLRVIYTIIDKT